MTEAEQESGVRQSLARDLLHFYDEFAEFNDYCVFLCDAVACLVTEDDILDTATSQGIGRYSGWIKHRVQALKQELGKIQEKSRQGSQ